MLAESETAIERDASGAAESDPARTIRCPTCRRRTAWEGNSQRPFCSLTCRLIDLGVWLDEGYRVPADERDVP